MSCHCDEVSSPDPADRTAAWRRTTAATAQTDRSRRTPPQTTPSPGPPTRRPSTAHPLAARGGGAFPLRFLGSIPERRALGPSIVPGSILIAGNQIRFDRALYADKLRRSIHH